MQKSLDKKTCSNVFINSNQKSDLKLNNFQIKNNYNYNVHENIKNIFQKKSKIISEFKNYSKYQNEFDLSGLELNIYDQTQFKSCQGIYLLFKNFFLSMLIIFFLILILKLKQNIFKKIKITM